MSGDESKIKAVALAIAKAEGRAMIFNVDDDWYESDGFRHERNDAIIPLTYEQAASHIARTGCAVTRALAGLWVWQNSKDLSSLSIECGRNGFYAGFWHFSSQPNFSVIRSIGGSLWIS